MQPARRLKVLHLITDAIHSQLHYFLAEFTDPEAAELVFASLSPAGRFQRELEARGVRCLAFDARGPGHYPGVVRRLAGWLRRERVDVIQTHLYAAGLVGGLAGRLAGTPLIVATGHHTHDVILHRRRKGRWPHFWLDCLANRWLADAVISPSEGMTADFVKWEGVPARRVATVPHGFDLDGLRPSPGARERVRAEFQLPTDAVVLVAVGRLYWIKAYPILLRAFAQTAAAFGDRVRLVIVGEGGDRDRLGRLAGQLGVGSTVTFAGLRADVPDVLAAADLFVHTAQAESFGQVYVEAAWVGLPGVVSAVGAAEEVFGHGSGGQLVRPGDVDGFVAGMQRLVADPGLRRRMGDAARERASRFTGRQMATGYLAEYRRRIHRPAGGGG